MVVVVVALAMALAVMVAVVMVLVWWSMKMNDAGDDDGRSMTTFVFPLQGRPAQSAHNPQWNHCSSTGAPEPIQGHARNAQVCPLRTWHVWEPRGSGQHPRAQKKAPRASIAPPPHDPVMAGQTS